MDLPLKTLRLDAGRAADIVRAADLLRGGGIVAFPTETVYGLGANALDTTAVARIFEAKQRPSWDPLIVHIADRQMLTRVARPGRDLPDAAKRTLEQTIVRHWPGPLTLLLARTPAIPDAVTAGRPLVGVRMPAHPVALELIRLAGVPLAAPSANLFGHTSPTTAAHVLADLDGRIDAVLDGGPCVVGLESTVAEMTPGGFVVYRAGAVELEGNSIFCERGETRGAERSQPSPGMELRHYAPRAKLILGETAVSGGGPVENSLVEQINRAAGTAGPVGVMLPEGWNPASAGILYPWGPWRDSEVLARRLFAGLRELDDRGAATILCPLPSADGLGRAIHDRLIKAARVPDC